VFPNDAITKLTADAPGECSFGAALGHGPDDIQGWGRVSLGEILDDQPRAFRDQIAKFAASGQALTSSYTVADPARPLKVSLAWTDPPGPTAGNAFVNNLDLRVVGPDGRFYNGNVTAGGASTANPSVTDPRNNLENVILPTGALTAGFQVTVTGTAIGGDGVPGDGDATDQDFALVVSNTTEGLPASAVAGTTSGPSGASPVPATTPPAAALALSFRARTITLDRRNVLRWSFASNRPALAGRVSFRSKSKIRVTAGKAKRRLSLGSARFTADSAGTASLRLRVSAKTARIVRRLKRLKVRATVVAGGQSVPVSLTLKPPKLRRR
jgi:hypothetical protein